MTIAYFAYFAYFYGSVLRQPLGSTRTISLSPIKKVFSPFFNYYGLIVYQASNV